jgi:beta-phosphoglucomutase-like phosphatase (HAD superfamily)
MKLEIPDGNFAGYIFDLDGTLVDTMPLHYLAWDEAMRRAGMPGTLSEDLFYSLGGVPTLRVAELLATHYGLKIDPWKVFHEKEVLFSARTYEAALLRGGLRRRIRWRSRRVAPATSCGARWS